MLIQTKCFSNSGKAFHFFIPSVKRMMNLRFIIFLNVPKCYFTNCNQFVQDATLVISNLIDYSLLRLRVTQNAL